MVPVMALLSQDHHNDPEAGSYSSRPCDSHLFPVKAKERFGVVGEGRSLKDDKRASRSSTAGPRTAGE
ncbi:UNVERIFIED_CONTAM: hypothetical protein FKN15_061052 [Acipenser sinensis]